MFAGPRRAGTPCLPPRLSPAAAWAASIRSARRSRCCSPRPRSSSPAPRSSSPGPARPRSSRSSTTLGWPSRRRAACSSRAIPGVQPVTVIAVTAGAALGFRARDRCRRDGRVRVELLPRPGGLDALADARLGRLRGRRGGSASARSPSSEPPCPSPSSATLLGFAFSFLMDVWASGSASTPTRGRPSGPCRSYAAFPSTSRTRPVIWRSRSPSAQGAPASARALRPPAAAAGRMGLKLVAPAARRAGTRRRPRSFSRRTSRQTASFAEAGGVASPALTAWAALGLVAAGQPPARVRLTTFERTRQMRCRRRRGRSSPSRRAALGDPALAGTARRTNGGSDEH